MAKGVQLEYYVYCAYEQCVSKEVNKGQISGSCVQVEDKYYHFTCFNLMRKK